MQGRAHDRKIRKGKSRYRCAWCREPILFRSQGTKATRHLHGDRQHDLCEDCARKAEAQGYARARRLGLRSTPPRA